MLATGVTLKARLLVVEKVRRSRRQSQLITSVTDLDELRSTMWLTTEW